MELQNEKKKWIIPPKVKLENTVYAAVSAWVREKSRDGYYLLELERVAESNQFNWVFNEFLSLRGGNWQRILCADGWKAYIYVAKALWKWGMEKLGRG